MRRRDGIPERSCFTDGCVTPENSPPPEVDTYERTRIVLGSPDTYAPVGRSLEHEGRRLSSTEDLPRLQEAYFGY